MAPKICPPTSIFDWDFIEMNRCSKLRQIVLTCCQQLVPTSSMCYYCYAPLSVSAFRKRQINISISILSYALLCTCVSSRNVAFNQAETSYLLSVSWKQFVICLLFFLFNLIHNRSNASGMKKMPYIDSANQQQQRQGAYLQLIVLCALHFQFIEYFFRTTRLTVRPGLLGWERGAAAMPSWRRW